VGVKDHFGLCQPRRGAQDVEPVELVDCNTKGASF
jgi:hypothetical protein